MAASGSRALLIDLPFGRGLWLLVPVALVWDSFVIADSVQFSVLVRESVPAYVLGTALTVLRRSASYTPASRFKRSRQFSARFGGPRRFRCWRSGRHSASIAFESSKVRGARRWKWIEDSYLEARPSA